MREGESQSYHWDEKCERDEGEIKEWFRDFVFVMPIKQLDILIEGQSAWSESRDGENGERLRNREREREGGGE